MQNEELIQSLRSDAEWAHGNEWETPITLGDHLDAAIDALEAAEKRIVELEAAQRWIPCAERLPTVSEYRNGDKFKSMDSNELVPFLVCCEDTEIPFRAFYDGKNWGDGWGKQNVTHWQHLPQPPQKGE
jgi:hypothetical protein